MSEPSASEISIFGVRVKIALIALCCLVAQTTAAVVLTRYSKMQSEIPLANGLKPEKYSNSSLVVSTEFVKFVASLTLVFVFDTAEKLRAEAKVARESKARGGSKGVVLGVGPTTRAATLTKGAVKNANAIPVVQGENVGGATAVVKMDGGGANQGAEADAASSEVLKSGSVSANITVGGEVAAPRTPHDSVAALNASEGGSAVVVANSAQSVSVHHSPTSQELLLAANSAAVDAAGNEGDEGGGMDMAEPAPLLSAAGFAARYAVWKSILYRENFKDVVGTLKLSVPALLYTIQNNVIYTALNNLEATTFQVGYQSKVVTTAVLSVLMLNRSLSPLKWTSLLILTVGIVLTQLQPATDGKPPPSPSVSSGASSIAGAARGFAAAVVTTIVKGGDGDVISASWTTVPTAPAMTTTTSPQIYEFEKETHNNQFVGMVAVMVASFCSAFAGVYFEKILKGTAPSVWVRNAQLAWFSMIIGMIGYLFSLDPDEPFRAADFFKGYSPLVYVLIAVQALGGLIIACVVKYADNILKGFATAVSIVLCGILSAVFMGFFPNFMFVLGSGTVILATMLYSKPDKK